MKQKQSILGNTPIQGGFESGANYLPKIIEDSDKIPNYFEIAKKHIEMKKAKIKQNLYQIKAINKNHFETMLNRKWKKNSGILCQSKQKAMAIIGDYAKSYSVVVFSPHNIFQNAKHAIDCDSFVFCASVIRAFREKTAELGRELVITADTGVITNDGKLYLVCIPVSDSRQDFTRNEISDFMFSGIHGQRALIVGDIELMYFNKVEKRGDYGFDQITIFEHHRWIKKIKSYIGKVQPTIFNTHEILEGIHYGDAYTSGALTADLIVKNEKWKRRARYLSVVGDKYGSHYPNLTVHSESCEDLARILNFIGIFMLPEKEELNKYKKNLLAIVSISTIISDCLDFKTMKQKISKYIFTVFGAEFDIWMKTIISPVVNLSIHSFLSNHEKIVVHQLDTEKNLTIPVQKETYYLLNQFSAYTDRILVQFWYRGDNIHIMASRGSENHKIDVSKIIENMPTGIGYGGKHVDRMGFQVPALLADKYGGPDYFLDIVIKNLECQNQKKMSVHRLVTPKFSSRSKWKVGALIIGILSLYVLIMYLFREQYQNLKVSSTFYFIILRDSINGLTTGLGFYLNEIWDVHIARVKGVPDLGKVFRALIIGTFVYSFIVMHIGYDYFINQVLSGNIYIQLLFGLVLIPFLFFIPLAMIAQETFIDDASFLKVLAPKKLIKEPKKALRFIFSVFIKSIKLYFNAFTEKVFWVLNFVNIIVYSLAWIAPVFLGGSLTLWVMASALIWAIVTPILLNSWTQHVDIFVDEK